MYVLKGNFKGQDIYFIKFMPELLWNTEFEIRHCSEVIEGARLFSDNELIEAEDLCRHLGDNFKIYPVCPSCNHEYDGYPALSRKDNKTKICSNCATAEALKEFMDYNCKI